MAPTGINEYVQVFGICRSFLVPSGTKLRVYNSDDKWGTTGDGTYEEFIGEDPASWEEYECR